MRPLKGVSGSGRESWDVRQQSRQAMKSLEICVYCEVPKPPRRPLAQLLAKTSLLVPEVGEASPAEVWPPVAGPGKTCWTQAPWEVQTVRHQASGTLASDQLSKIFADVQTA